MTSEDLQMLSNNKIREKLIELYYDTYTNLNSQEFCAKHDLSEYDLSYLLYGLEGKGEIHFRSLMKFLKAFEDKGERVLDEIVNPVDLETENKQLKSELADLKKALVDEGDKLYKTMQMYDEAKKELINSESQTAILKAKIETYEKEIGNLNNYIEYLNRLPRGV